MFHIYTSKSRGIGILVGWMCNFSDTIKDKQFICRYAIYYNSVYNMFFPYAVTNVDFRLYMSDQSITTGVNLGVEIEG